MKMSYGDTGWLRVALELAVAYEESLIECHWNSVRKRYFDTETVRKCRARIKTFRRLDRKLAAMMEESKLA